MGILKDLLGGSADSEDLDNYVELDADQATVADAAEHTLHIAEYNTQRDLMAVKDALYDGGIVLLDISTLRGEERTKDRIVEDLRRTVEDVGGDIVQKGDEQVILTTRAVAISREKLSE